MMTCCYNVTEENRCVVLLNETSNVRQLGDDYIDEASCLQYRGCYRREQTPRCYHSLGKKNHTVCEP